MARVWRTTIVVGSVGVHALAIGLVARWQRPIERHQIVESAPEPAAPPTTEIELVTLSDVSAGGSSGSGGETRARGSLGRGVIAASHEAASSGETPGPRESLRMRGRRHDLSVPSAAIERIAASAEPVKPPATDDRLLPRGGTHVILDRVVTVTVDRDGNAHLLDRKDIDLKLTLPAVSIEELRTGLGQNLTAWYADPYRDTRAGRVQDLPRHLTAVPGACERFGDAMCETEPDDRPVQKSLSRGILPAIGGNADLTAWLHRKFIGDPYASRKLKLLDTTREARVQIGTTHRAEQRARASELAQRNLETLWQTTRDLAERKAALFSLWDECLEAEGKDGEAGARARAIVLGWIRAKLPAGSPDAYTADEIAKLDARRTSRQHFAPY